jgi:tetratricopeptide (TPR) repeat protein
MFTQLILSKKARFWIVVLLFGVGEGTSIGCRAIEKRLPDSRLVRGRQLSSRGADLLRRSRYADAESLFCEAINSCPNDDRAHWGYATTLWNNNQRQTAIQHMREAVRLSGNNPEYAVRLGEMYLAQGDQQGAEDQARQVLKTHRDRADAWALLGDAQFQADDWNNAIESYHRALLIQSDYPKVQLAVAETYRRIGKPNRALATIDRMIDMHPAVVKSGETQLARAKILIELDRRQEAIVALKSIGDSLPIDDPMKQLDVVACYSHLGELVDARMSLGRIVQHHPRHPNVLAFQSQLDHSFAHLAEQANGPLNR